MIAVRDLRHLEEEQFGARVRGAKLSEAASRIELVKRFYKLVRDLEHSTGTTARAAIESARAEEAAKRKVVYIGGARLRLSQIRVWA